MRLVHLLDFQIYKLMRTGQSFLDSNVMVMGGGDPLWVTCMHMQAILMVVLSADGVYGLSVAALGCIGGLVAVLLI